MELLYKHGTPVVNSQENIHPTLTCKIMRVKKIPKKTMKGRKFPAIMSLLTVTQKTIFQRRCLKMV